MNLLMFNLAVDAEHVTLAFGLRWIEKLAGGYDHVDVVTMSAGQYALPSNVTVWSLGRERGYAEWVRVIRFYWIVWQILRKRRIAVVFTHMIPVFAVLFWPVARLSGLRNVLWYAHGATPKMLKLAHLVVDKVVSSTPQGFRLPSSKACFIGQGIDTGVYQFHPRQPRQVFHLVTVGRISPSKNLELLVRSLANWQAEAARNWHLSIVGDGTTDEERGYAARLRQQVNNMLGHGKVTFTGRLNAEQVSSVLAEADLFISLGATGSLDKAIVEAMVSGCPVVSSNDAFRAIAHQSGFSCAVIEPTVGEVCAALSRFAAMAPDDIQALANKQAAVAVRDHTLDGLTQRMARILAGMAR